MRGKTLAALASGAVLVSGAALSALSRNRADHKQRERVDPPAPTLPSLALPPIQEPVSSLKEAISKYPNGELALGICEGGTVSVRLAQYPHIVLYGGTGSGKSTITRDWATQFRAAGWGVHIGDGLGCAWSDHRGLPGVVGIGGGPTTSKGGVLDIIDVMHEMVRERIAAQDMGHRQVFSPQVLIVDDADTLMEHWTHALPKERFAALMDDMRRILTLGPHVRCHVVFVASTRSSLEGTGWLRHVPTVILAGTPERWMGTLLPVELRDEWEQRCTGSSAWNLARGRCVALLRNHDGDELVEYQSYYGYPMADGYPVFVPEEVAVSEARDEYARKVFDRIPDLYSRKALD